jgi:5-methylcytosine-specific restriction endonuclease McrA
MTLALEPDQLSRQWMGSPSRLQHRQSVVLFSQNYLPMTRIGLKRAAILLLSGRAEPVDMGGQTWQMRSPSVVVTIPEHLRLTIGSPDRVWKLPPVNRREVFRRDGQRCQYCGSRTDLTLDHVIPRALGGPHTWENVVTACAPCNGRKGARTPEMAKMPLKLQPKAPLHPVIAFAEQFWKAGQSDF